MVQPLRRFLTVTPTVRKQVLSRMAHVAAAVDNSSGLDLLLTARPLSDSEGTIPCDQTICIINSRGGFQNIKSSGGTALHASARFNQIGAAEVVLKNNCDIDQRDQCGATPLFLAAFHGHENATRLLLSRQASIDIGLTTMQTPLMSASYKGHLGIVTMLITHGADVRAETSDGSTALTHAAQGKNLTIFKILRSSGLSATLLDLESVCRNRFFSLLMLVDEWAKALNDGAALFRHQSILSYRPIARLSQCSVRRCVLTLRGSSYNCTQLYTTAYQGECIKCMRLLQAGALLNIEGGKAGTPLMAACEHGHLNMVRMLVRNGALLSYCKGAKVVSAFKAAKSHPKIIEWLLSKRFTEQWRICDSNEHRAQEPQSTVEPFDKVADVGLELALEDDVDEDLESKNWFLPMRRFVDGGNGSFEEVPINPSEFWKFRPAYCRRRARR